MTHATLDQQIMAAVDAGHRKFADICIAVKCDLPRKVDRRLQYLRKRGHLIFDSKSGWQRPTSDK